MSVTGLVALAASSALAQGRPGERLNIAGLPAGTIDGIVSDTALAPVQAAFVSILGTPLRVGTGPNGRFRITKLQPGQYLLIVKRVGFKPISGVIEVPSNDTLRLSYTMEPAPVTLPTVEVKEKVASSRLQEFEQRRRLGIGEFMTLEEIERRNSAYSTELLRKFKAVNVAPDQSGPITQYYAISAREGGNPSGMASGTTGVTNGTCPMQVYLDEVPLPTPFNLDLLPPPKDLAGIEVYAGSSTIPLRYSGMNRGCGVILVWSRDVGVQPR